LLNKVEYFFSDQEREICPVDLAIDHNLKTLQNNPKLKTCCQKIMTYQEYKKFKDFGGQKLLPVSNKFAILSDKIDSSSVIKRGVNNNLESPMSANGFNPTDDSDSVDETSFYMEEWDHSINDETSISDASIDEDSKLEEMGPMTEWKGVHSVRLLMGTLFDGNSCFKNELKL
jgi:hypothetical protein